MQIELKENDTALVLLLKGFYDRGFGLPLLEAIKDNIHIVDYIDFSRAIAKAMNIDFDNVRNDERLFKYLTDIAIDVHSQYAATKSLMVNADLDIEWYMYNGSNLTTTRPFCLAMTKKKYFHVCEIPRLIAGEFKEFEVLEDSGYDDNEIPSGMYANTNVDNFLIYRGGYGCGHSAIAIDEVAIPVNIKTALYGTDEYNEWKANK